MYERNADLPMSGQIRMLTLWLCVSTVLLVRLHSADSASSQLATREEVVCNGGDYRGKVQYLNLLQNCTVIEGHLKILFYQKGAAVTISKLVFPKLREITGYLLLHRVYGLKSVGRMFPNLSVIRGRELFFNYALVVYEMPQLEDLGLRNLRTIMRGSVRLEKNPELCYVNSIDWQLIIPDKGSDDNFFIQNKMVGECDVCPTKCARLYSGNQLTVRSCWNGRLDFCQLTCPDHCERMSGCKEDDRSTCCHSQCVGGCYGLGADQCVACKYIFHDGVCLPNCPAGTFTYHDRRCLTADECRSSTKYQGAQWKPFRGKCILECPRAQGFKEDENDKATCVPCAGKCPKVCSGIHVDSVANAQRLKGCTIISSYLDIQITKGTNVVQELEENLSMIEEVAGHVKVTRSAALVSLSFLKNLRLIRGEDFMDTNNYSLYVVDNRNLQEIWNMTTHPNLTILNGTIYFDLNRKLCVDKIYALADQIGQPNPPEQSVSTRTNGDEGACDVGPIEADVKTVASEYALLKWNRYEMPDDRYLMGYVVWFREAEFRNVSIFGQRDACGDDVWKIEDYALDSKKRNQTVYIHLLSELKPWTQYVVYVQTYTVALSKKSGRSRLMYFTTQPDFPTHPRDLVVESHVPGELLVRWKPPSQPKGNVTHYHVYWVAQKLSRAKIDLRDYCTDKIQTYSQSLERNKATVEVDRRKQNVSDCACDTPKQEKVLNNERLYQIEFENYLHNYVYQKRPTSMRKSKRKKKGPRISDVSLGKAVNRSSGENEAATKIIPIATTTQSPRRKADHHEPFVDVLPVPSNDTAAEKNGTESAIDNGDDDEQGDDGDDDAEANEYLVAVVYNKLEVVLPNLRQFQTYNIEIMACQEYVASVDEKLCSNRAIISAITQPLKSADNILAESIRTEFGERGEIVIYWDEPKEPNGMIVTYEIQVTRDVGTMEKQVPTCIPHKQYRVRNSYRISRQAPGNYTFRLRATSLAGVGEWTPLRSFHIDEVPIYGPLTVGSIVGIVVFVTLFVFGVIAVAACTWFYISKQRSLSRMPDVLYSSVNPEYMSYEYTPDEWEVEREKVTLGESLGQGSFGMVYEGVYKSDKELLKCAVKTVNPNSSESEKRNFLREASVMKAFDCYHVVRLMGVVSKGQPALVLMELMMNGDLKSFLRSRRPDYADPGVKPPTTAQIWRMALEIADGMAYLSSKKYVHRDLAARNCMVAEDFTVKIGDFGMTRDIYETDYYKKGGKDFFPVRWMAPESLHDGVFTSASDVWSYGVVLWEIATLAAQPYQGHSNEQVLNIVVKGGIMERPQGCPRKLCDLMQRCWKYSVKERPNFGEIIEYLVKEKSFDYVKFYHFSFFLGQAKPETEKEKSKDDVIELGDSVPTALREVGHISPSHRVSFTPRVTGIPPKLPAGEVTSDETRTPCEPAIATCTDDGCDSSRNCKSSAITNSCSGESSRGSTKSNGSALTNGLANGHAHRPVNC